MSGALEGIRVIDLSRALAGAYGSVILGELGAEIIKIANIPSKGRFGIDSVTVGEEIPITIKGEVVGLAIARVDPERGEGIYYAVSSSKVKRVADSIIELGYFDYPWLGIYISNVTLEEADTRNFDSINGALVKEIVDGSPSDIAGMSIDDVILALDGQSITDVASLISYLAEYYSVGDEVKITVLRDKDIIVLSLTIGKRPS